MAYAPDTVPPLSLTLTITLSRTSFVMVRVEGVDGGETKQTQVATGSKPAFNQTLEFVVTPAPGARGCGGDVVLYVSDKYMFKECLVRIPCRAGQLSCALRLLAAIP